MQFLMKDFEQYYFTELKGNFTVCEDKTIRKAFIFDKYVLIMRKAKKMYQVIQSGSCGFEPMFHFTTFDLLYQSEIERDVEDMFLSYVTRLCTGVILNELHKSEHNTIQG